MINLNKSKLYTKTKAVDLNNIKEVLKIATEVQRWIKEKAAYAVALNQLGYDFNCFVLNGNRLGIIDEIIINPLFIPQKKAKRTISIESCLSFPFDEFRIKRFNKIWFFYDDKYLTQKKYKMHGINSVICQHEISHLKGIPDDKLHIED